MHGQLVASPGAATVSCMSCRGIMSPVGLWARQPGFVGLLLFLAYTFARKLLKSRARLLLCMASALLSHGMAASLLRRADISLKPSKIIMSCGSKELVTDIYLWWQCGGGTSARAAAPYRRRMYSARPIMRHGRLRFPAMASSRSTYGGRVCWQ